MKTQCPHCNTQTEIPVEFLDKTARCDFCKKLFLAEDIATMKFLKAEQRQPPKSDYLRFFGGVAIAIACICILIGLSNENETIDISGLILFSLGIITIGIGTIIRAINANTEEIKKTRK
jgi:phage FluMu protein Com